jgi:hypothetical protein
MPISLSGSLNLSGSLTTTGTITATTLVVQTITSSISSITGSTNFGSIVGNTHQFTGSMLVSGSATFSGSVQNIGGSGFQSSVEGGFRLRNDANTVNLGGLVRRSYWAGGAATDMQIFAETGNGIYLNVNGSISSGLTIASTGAATFSSSVTAASGLYNGYTSGLPPTSGSATRGGLRLNNASNIALDFGTVAAGQAWLQVSDAGNYASNFALLLNPNGGNVGIGNTVADTINSSSGLGNLVVGNGSGSSQGITIYTNSSTYGGLNFADATSGGGAYAGYLKFDHTNDSMQFFIGNTERMRITSGGRIGIGTDIPASNMQLGRVFGLIEDVNSGYITANRGTNENYIVSQYAVRIHLDSAQGHINFDTAPSGTAGTYATLTNVMRITSDGRFLVRTTSVLSPGGVGGVSNMLNPDDNGLWALALQNNATTNTNGRGLGIRFTTDFNNSSNEVLWFVGNATPRFYVTSDGGVRNYSANNSNLSDIRVKKDIIALESYWDKFKAIEIVKFKYKDQTHDDFNIGVIAQQVENIAPEFVNIDGFGGEQYIPEDGIPLKSIYESDLHHATIKVLQECMAKIEEQQAQIEELKALINK